MTSSTTRVLVCACALAACSRTLPALSDAEISPADSVFTETSPASTRNACGGEAPLATAPGAACGTCGRWVCDGADSLACDDRDTRNACGLCGPAPAEVCNDRDDDCDGAIDEGCVRRVAVVDESETRVRVSGERCAIETARAGAVYIARFSDGSLERVPEPPYAGTARRSLRDVAFDADTVAFVQELAAEGGPVEHAVYAHSLRTGARRLLTPSPTQGATPAVDGARVLFAAAPSADSPADLWLWEGTEAPPRRVTATDAHERTPDLSGPWAVFVRADTPDARGALVAHHLDTGEERTLSEGLEGYPEFPAIDGSRVVWHQRNEPAGSNPAATVQLYELASRTRRALTVLGHTFVPRISGERVCWSTWPLARAEPTRSGNDATVYDLRTGLARVVSPSGYLCDLDATRTVFLEARGDGDSYFAPLTPERP